MLIVDKDLIQIQSFDTSIEGTLMIPKHAMGLVLFAHGSGSSRFSRRNNFVADQLHSRRIGTLLIDLLTPAEDADFQRRFDISLLTQRLDSACDWLAKNAHVSHLPIGLFGASTGAAAAFRVAAHRRPTIAAVVSRGGRPDLAGSELLEKVRAPSLLIVGGDDDVVVGLNRQAYKQLHCLKRLEIIPGASHLFEEPGKLQAVAALAAEWFRDYLPKSPN
jgi:putative phosphoribosyl transferase